MPPSTRRGGALAPAVLAALALLVCTALPAMAHAILVESTPAPKSTVGGPNVDIKLRFNSRVDGARSLITLEPTAGTAAAESGAAAKDGAKSQKLAIDKQAQPDTLTARAAGLAAGDYLLRWQVLAADGHITRGEVRFQVK